MSPSSRMLPALVVGLLTLAFAWACAAFVAQPSLAGFADDPVAAQGRRSVSVTVKPGAYTGDVVLSPQSVTSINRASSTEATMAASLRAQRLFVMKFVDPSNPLPAALVPSDEPVIFRRASPDDANGIALPIRPAVSMLSPTVQRLALVFNDQI